LLPPAASVCASPANASEPVVIPRRRVECGRGQLFLANRTDSSGSHSSVNVLINRFAPSVINH
jgi:hypothetical protein